jgi:hypothetical protein
MTRMFWLKECTLPTEEKRRIDFSRRAGDEATGAMCEIV